MCMCIFKIKFNSHNLREFLFLLLTCQRLFYNGSKTVHA